jgi:hypothetical protein
MLPLLLREVSGIARICMGFTPPPVAAGATSPLPPFCRFALTTPVARVAQILRVTAFCVVLLVASIPIAMRVVCTTTMALGCRSIADEKAIVTRLSAVEDLAGMTILCSDKTGTLTLNEMRLQARDYPPLRTNACGHSSHVCIFSQGEAADVGVDASPFLPSFAEGDAHVLRGRFEA